MAGVRVLDCYEHTSWKDELDQVEYLLRCLGKERSTCYRIIDKPDEKNRQSPQPDYLIENSKKGDLITIEHTRLFASERRIERISNLAKKLGIVSQWINFPTPEHLGKRLSEFVSKKLSKGQFRNFSHTERILLAIDQSGGIRNSTLVKAEPYIKLPEPVDCDHFYLILVAEPVLVEVF